VAGRSPNAYDEGSYDEAESPIFQDSRWLQSSLMTAVNSGQLMKNEFTARDVRKDVSARTSVNEYSE